jgi:hypothetical protein
MLHQYKLQALEHGVRCISDRYVNANTPIMHQCLKDISHEWLARPNSIKHGHGCPHCAGNIKFTLDQYRLQALKHGVRCIADKYLGIHEPILHQCLKDPSHIWMARPGGIKRGRGCPHCAGNIKLTLDEYKLQALEHGARCIADEYINDYTPIMHQCLKESNHEWLASPSSIKQNEGCPHCAGNIKLTLDQYRLQALEHGMACIATEYLGASTPIQHQCLKDFTHTWLARPYDIKQDHGCPHCNNLRQEPRCRAWFENYFGKLFPKSRPKWLRNKGQMELDGYCEELKIAFEYNGVQHYAYRKKFSRTAENLEDQQHRDCLKIKLCAEYGVKLVVVPYWEKNVEAFLEDCFSGTYMAF